jgi:hypothetical protein
MSALMDQAAGAAAAELSKKTKFVVALGNDTEYKLELENKSSTLAEPPDVDVEPGTATAFGIEDGWPNNHATCHIMYYILSPSNSMALFIAAQKKRYMIERDFSSCAVIIDNRTRINNHIKYLEKKTNIPWWWEDAEEIPVAEFAIGKNRDTKPVRYSKRIDGKMYRIEMNLGLDMGKIEMSRQ